VVLVILVYIPPLYDVMQATFSGSEGYWPD
jgi:hypothetical protein